MKYFLLFIAVLIALSSYPQENHQFIPGLVLGSNVSQIEGDGYAGFDKMGIRFGGLVSSQFKEKFSAAFEIVYTQKGSLDPSDPSKGDFRYNKIKLDYVEVPVSIRYHYKKLILEAGFCYGRLIREKFFDLGGEYTALNSYNKSDYNAHLGVQYQFTKALVLQYRTSRSLLPISSFAVGPPILRFMPFGSYGYALSLTLAYQFAK